MTELNFSADRICDLQPGDEVWIGQTPYSVRQFSRGGMGLVLFLERDDARNANLSSAHGPAVAVKTILLSPDEEAMRSLFHRELTIWAGLNHPNIVSLNEILVTRSDGWVAAMDWCSGSLADTLGEVKRLSIEQALFIVQDVVAGLQHAASTQGVLHLDFKPANILYQHDLDRGLKYRSDSIRQYRWKVSDWGLASIKANTLAKSAPSLDALSRRSTLNNQGTLAYMAPERFIPGFRSSIASDMFAVGLVLFEMIVGRLPYQDAKADVADQIRSHSYFQTAKSLLIDRKIHARIADTILKLIAPDPNRRFTDYEELLQHMLQSHFRSFFSRLFNP